MQLQELKKQLESHREDRKKQKLLFEKREQDFHELHQLKKDTTQFAALKKSVRELDALLDLFGEEDHEGELEKVLISRIHETFPESKAEYMKIGKTLSDAQARHTDLEEQYTLLAPFDKLLKQGAAIPLKGKWLQLLLGKHPKAQLALIIKKSMTLAEKIEPKIEEVDLKNFLTKFLRETGQTWNHALYSGRFTELAIECHEHLFQLQLAITKTENTISKESQASAAWIEKYSSNSTQRR